MEDDDGFEGYVETTVDPGPWVIVATAIYCSLFILLFPCMVSLGRRYEKRRMGVLLKDDKESPLEGERQVDDEEVGIEAPLPHREKDNGRACRSEPLPTTSIPFEYHKTSASTSRKLCSFSSEDDFHVKRGNCCKKRSEVFSDSAPSSYVRGGSGIIDAGHPGAPIRITDKGTESQWKMFIDKLIMPPYPDDAGQDIGIARKVPSEPNSYEGRNSITLLDTGAAQRNRQAGARRYCRGQRDRMWHQEQEQERRASLIARGKVDDPVTTSAVLMQGTNHKSSSEKINNGWSNSTAFPNADNTSSSASRDYVRSNSPSLFRLPSRGSENEERFSSGSSVFQDNIVIMPEDAIDAKDPGQIPLEKVPMEGEDLDLCCGSHAWWKPFMIAAGFDRILDVAYWDREMKRILSLSIPFSLSAVFSGLFEAVRIGLVAHHIGTDAVAAYTIVLLILGLTEEFFGGFALTSASLCSHAVGRQNYKLAGEYVQISIILYTLCMIPNILVWMFFTGDVVRLFGFNEATVQMAQTYARFYVIAQWFGGLDEAYGSLLAVIEHERFCMYLSIASGIFSTSVILGTCLTKPVTLEDVGALELGTEALFFGFSVVLSNLAGWVTKCMEGMIRTNALRNIVAVRTVIKTAIPLALGQLLQYGEWEVLTIFVASLGPAEVTAYGIVGSIWDTLEALTEGFGDAGEIRVAYHLGSGRPAMARLSSYKCIFVSVICATLVTSVMWLIGENLASWLTPDTTLQYLIIQVLPLMGMGNIALTAGSVSWALVGAQGRYRLATFVAFVGSWCVTLPLAAIYTYALNINLEGVTSAVVVGYSVTGTSLSYILVRSDWERLSRILVDLNEESESSESSSSSSPSSSSSSSSASFYSSSDTEHVCDKGHSAHLVGFKQ